MEKKSKKAEWILLTVAIIGGLWVYGSMIEQDRARYDESRYDVVGTSSGQNLDRLARQMANVNAGYVVEDGDITINRFRYLLSSLAGKLQDGQSGDLIRRAADMILLGKEYVRDECGREVSLLNFAEGVVQSALSWPTQITFDDFKSLVGSFAILLCG